MQHTVVMHWSAGWSRCPRNRRPTDRLSVAKYGLGSRLNVELSTNFLGRFLAGAPAVQHRQNI